LEFPLEHLFLSFHGLDPIISTHDVTLFGVFGRVFSSQETKDFETDHPQHKDTDLISGTCTYTMYLFQKEYSVILQMTSEQRYYTIKTHAWLSFQTIMKHEKVSPSPEVKERDLEAVRKQ
jgi:hypothetical protein